MLLLDPGGTQPLVDLQATNGFGLFSFNARVCQGQESTAEPAGVDPGFDRCLCHLCVCSVVV